MINSRIKSIVVIFTVWSLLIIACLFYFSLCSHSKYLKESNRVLFKEGKIVAVRGIIFDKDGKKLAWCDRNYNLCIDTRKIYSVKQKNYLINQLKKIFPAFGIKPEVPFEDNVIVKKDLTPKELLSIQYLLSKNPALNIKPVFKRVAINIPAVKKYIGTAVFTDGHWVGLSGIEKKYNSYLNGTDGLYRVMLDKRGRWIEGSGVIKRKMVPGKNLFLKESMKDIAKNL